MRRLLQNEGHADVGYDRPNLPWVCGNAAEGCPCPLGPLARGRCPEAPECKPVRVGDQWQCNRPASQGGPCDAVDETGGQPSAGPTADGKCCRVHRCRPVRSLRVFRGRMAIGAAVFAFGALTMLVGSAWRQEILAPGPLTQSHAQLLTGGASQNRCAACHPGGVDAALGLPSAPASHATQSALCVECHESLIPTELALSPHTTTASMLSADREAGTGQGSSATTTAVACAACHQEHHGADHDLTAMSNGRCQACHSERYDSFATDHPDFGHWPYVRRTRINFDHNTHMSKHFAEKGEKFACATCHTDGPRGDVKLMVGFEQSCARCHESGIEASIAGGLEVISLPMMDRRAIADAGGDLGRWPAAATGDFDGELLTIAKLLLTADPQAARALDRLGADFSFFDLDPDSAQDAGDAAVLAEALRRLITGLAERGHEEIFDRVAQLSCSGSQDCRDDLPGGAPIDLIELARWAWFSGEADSLGSIGGDRTAIDVTRRQTSGGWLFDNQSLSLRYAPRGHADPLLRAWIELAASLTDEHAELRAAALAELAGPRSAGLCATCHSIEAGDQGSLLVNWRAAGARDERRQFTQFSHRPHVTQPHLADCTHCHRLDSTADRQTAPYRSTAPTDFVHQFQAVSKAACIECHRPKAAGDSCTQCHNYHVDARE